MPSLEELVFTAQIVVTELNKKLLQIEEIHQDIKRLRDSSSSIPEQFNKKFKEIVDLTSNYTNSLGGVTKTYLDGNNTLLTSKINELSNKIKEIEKEISRLVNIDFNKLFADLQKKIIDQTKAELAIELNKFDEKSKDLQNKINDLRKQVDRIESVDLVYHFDKLQKTLSDIFGAINAINLTLTGLTTSLNSVIQLLGQIQKTVEDKFKESNKLINNFNTETNSHLNQQDKKNNIEFEILKKEVATLSEQNINLKKEIKTNRIIQIVGLVITISLIIFFIIKH